MSGKKIVYLLFAAALAAVVFYFLVSVPSREEREANNEALGALFGGGGGVQGAPSQRGQGEGEGSMFESNFWGAGVPDTAIADSVRIGDEGEPEILEKASEGNPLNPQTGQPFTDDVMAQFDRLRQKFPDNRIIPRRLSAEERHAEENQQGRLADIQQKMSGNNASPEEITEYYDFQAKMTNDRLALIDYVLQEQGESMSEEVRKQYEEVRSFNQKQIEMYNEAKQRAISASAR
jgi:hypothetical protein